MPGKFRRQILKTGHGLLSSSILQSVEAQAKGQMPVTLGDEPIKGIHKA
jgi:hypothetical protein